MSTKPTHSLQGLRDRRRRADDWINRASWTAIATAVLGGLGVLVAITVDPGSLEEGLALFPTLVAQGLVGYQLREHRMWPAWGLMASYLASLAVTTFVYGIWSGIVLKVLIGYVYVRGFIATVYYKDLTEQITAATRDAA